MNEIIPRQRPLRLRKMSTRIDCIRVKSAPGPTSMRQAAPVLLVNPGRRHDESPGRPAAEPAALHRRFPGYAPTATRRRAGPRRRARARTPERQGRVGAPRAAVVQDPRRVVGGVPTPRRSARSRAAVVDLRRSSARVRAARTAHTRRRHRRQSRPRGCAHGEPARLCGTHLRARGHGAGRASKESRAKARRSPSSTEPTTTRCARRPRSPPTTCWSCPTRRGRATPMSRVR